ncbi:hypothetical protein V8G54_024004 [Vigna mungo]|uniref:WAT1-related protein n=1 Tax=Vigna mungo TaxID=3915 RepID=A0AAQ3RS50_VIGMU
MLTLYSTWFLRSLSSSPACAGTYEKLNLQTVAGKAKVMGTTIGVSGSMMLSFFKGIEIKIWKNMHINLMHKTDHNQTRASDGKECIGILSGLGCCLSFSVWLIIQVYGIAINAFVNIVTLWCVHKRGPLYAFVFNPLTLVLVAATAPLLLQEKLYLRRYTLFLLHHIFI